MARKVIIDCDPGIDDAIALCLALFEPRLEVVAVTATAGNVWANQATRNVQATIEQLDPPRYPRIGVATHSQQAPPTADARQLHGNDGLGNADFVVSELHHQHPSEKIICDEVRAAPGNVTIISLGPLTNIANAFRRDPELESLVDRLIMLGGSVDGVGNVTAAAEFNMYCDPHSARAVFSSLTTKTLVPLDVTSQVSFNLDFVDELPDQFSRAGAFLHKLVPFSFRAHHQQLGMESIHIHDAVAVLAAIHSELFETEEMAGDVETAGELTAGATVFDRRRKPQWRPNMEVATSVDVASVKDCIVRGLARAGECA